MTIWCALMLIAQFTSFLSLVCGNSLSFSCLSVDRNCNERSRSAGTVERRTRRRKPSWTEQESAPPPPTQPPPADGDGPTEPAPAPAPASSAAHTEMYPGQTESMRRITQLVKDAGQ